jgi:hypothetical protein
LGTVPFKFTHNNGYKYKNGDKSGSPITLRLDKEIESRLRSEADRQDPSINAITNKALRKVMSTSSSKKNIFYLSFSFFQYVIAFRPLFLFVSI